MRIEWNMEMSPTRAHGSELGATVHCGEIKIQRDFSVGRRDQGIVEDVIEIAAAMPLVGFVLAIIFAGGGVYFQWVNPKNHDGLRSRICLVLLGLAVICALASLFGFVRQKLNIHRRSQRLDAQRSIEDLRQLSPSGFEQTIADLFRRQGLSSGRNRWSRRWRSGFDPATQRRRLDRAPGTVQALYKLEGWRCGSARILRRDGRAIKAAAKEFFVTCGRYTAEARTFAAGKPIRLIDGDELLSMLVR